MPTKQFTFKENPQSEEPRIGAFEVVLKRPGEEDVLIWSKIQVGEPKDSSPATLEATGAAIVSEIKSCLNQK